MAQDISLLGAVYSDVPSVLLPKQGGGTAQFDDTTDADATASDILTGKTAYVNGVKITGTGTGGGGSVTQDQDGFIVLPTTGGGGGGGSSNMVQGTFTTGDTAGVSSFSIPYSGSGYPIMFLAYVNGGIWNGTSGGDSDWYSLVQRYAIGLFMISKQETNTTPTYASSSSLTQNLATVSVCYKNSTSDATVLAMSGGANVVSFNSGNAETTQNNVMRFKDNGTTVSYYVSTTSRGLAPNTTYAYIVVYSS